MAARKVTIKVEKTKVKSRLVYALVGTILWVGISLILVGVAVERFQNEENYLELGLWCVGIIAGYVFFLRLLGVRRKKPKEEPEEE